MGRFGENQPKTPKSWIFLPLLGFRHFRKKLKGLDPTLKGMQIVQSQTLINRRLLSLSIKKPFQKPRDIHVTVFVWPRTYFKISLSLTSYKTSKSNLWDSQAGKAKFTIQKLPFLLPFESVSTKFSFCLGLSWR